MKLEGLCCDVDVGVDAEAGAAVDVGAAGAAVDVDAAGGAAGGAGAGAVEAVGVTARGRGFACWAVRSGSVDMVRAAQPLVEGRRTGRPTACRTGGRMSGWDSSSAGEEGRVVAGNWTWAARLPTACRRCTASRSGRFRCGRGLAGLQS